MPKKKNPHVSIELKPSRIVPGEVGVFAIYGFNKGEFIEVPEAYGPIVFLNWNEIQKLDKAVQDKVKNFCFMMPDGAWVPMNFDRLPVTWFLNHSCDYNVGFGGEDYFVAVKNIQAGEELFLDYGLCTSYPDFKMTCMCGSVNCRKTITGNDWQNSDFSKQNKKYMFSEVRNLSK